MYVSGLCCACNRRCLPSTKLAEPIYISHCLWLSDAVIKIPSSSQFCPHKISSSLPVPFLISSVLRENCTSDSSSSLFKEFSLSEIAFWSLRTAIRSIRGLRSTIWLSSCLTAFISCHNTFPKEIKGKEHEQTSKTLLDQMVHDHVTQQFYSELSKVE